MGGWLAIFSVDYISDGEILGKFVNHIFSRLYQDSVKLSVCFIEQILRLMGSNFSMCISLTGCWCLTSTLRSFVFSILYWVVYQNPWWLDSLKCSRCCSSFQIVFLEHLLCSRPCAYIVNKIKTLPSRSWHSSRGRQLKNTYIFIHSTETVNKNKSCLQIIYILVYKYKQINILFNKYTFNIFHHDLTYLHVLYKLWTVGDGE